MEMTISIPDDIASKLGERAAQSGESVPAYTAKLVVETVTHPSVDEVLAPFRKQVADSGMSNEQLDSFFGEIREKAFRDQQNSP